MHAMISNGIGQNETAALLTRLLQVGCTFGQLRQYVSARWEVCSGLASRTVLSQIVCEAREKSWKSDKEHFKCSASEMLLVFPVILFFLQTVMVGHGMDDQIASYAKLGRVMHLVSLGKQSVQCGTELQIAIQAHGEAFGKAYPDFAWKPKNHFIHHVPKQVDRDGLLLDAFVGERKHQLIKAEATVVKNTSDFEKSVLIRVVANQIAELSDPNHFRDRLLYGKLLEDTGDSYARSMVFTGTKLSRGDCIFVGGKMCIARAFVESDGAFFVATERWVHQTQAFNITETALAQIKPMILCL
jgi:hypothetical protein